MPELGDADDQHLRRRLGETPRELLGHVTELHFGDAAQELTRRLAEAPAQMLIVGISELRQFATAFRTLLEGGRWPVLIVQRGTS